MFAWIPIRTRVYHLGALALVLFSWIALGYWFGFGYCVLTDWHWTIKKHLGETDLPSSFIAYALKHFFGISLSDYAIAVIAYAILGGSLVMSIALNIRDYYEKRKKLKF